MITRLTTIKCERCGMIFNEVEDYFDGRSVFHDNQTCEGNMQSAIDRVANGSETMREYFIKLIGLYGNICNMHDINYQDIMDCFKCQLSWLYDNAPTELYEYTYYRTHDIKAEFNKVINLMNEEKENNLNLRELVA